MFYPQVRKVYKIIGAYDFKVEIHKSPNLRFKIQLCKPALIEKLLLTGLKKDPVTLVFSKHRTNIILWVTQPINNVKYWPLASAKS